MITDCRDCPLRRRPGFATFSREDLEVTRRFKAGEMTVEPGTALLDEGTKSPQMFTVLSGLGLRSKLLPNGRRQVISFVFPGDFLGLQSGLMDAMKHSVASSTRMRLCVFERAEIGRLFAASASRALDVTWTAAAEEHLVAEAMTQIGQAAGRARIAWAMIRLYRRGEIAGLVENGAMEIPWRQQDLADAMGLSLVHTNKSLASLRGAQIASWADGRLRVDDMGALIRVAGGEPEAPEPRALI